MTANSATAQPLEGRIGTYFEDLPDDISPFRELLEKYSNIPPEKVNEHLYAIVCISYSKFSPATTY